MQGATAYAHFFAGRYAEACSWAKMAVRENPNFVLVPCLAAASSALAGRADEAREALAHLRQLEPGLKLSNLREHLPIRRTEDFARLEEGMRQAGLPE
jgi:adenylate cyclase